jgi:hypothetical protein
MRIISAFLSALIWCSGANAGLPPTTTLGPADVSRMVTFNTTFGGSGVTVTHSGASAYVNISAGSAPLPTQFVASCDIGQASCNWSTNSSSAPAAMNSNSSCTTVTQEVNGSGSCGTSDSAHLPQFTLTLPSKGYYCARMDFRSGGAAGGRCAYRINDGANTYGNAAGIPTQNTDDPFSVEACFNYTSFSGASSVTFQLYGYSSTGQCTVHGGDDGNANLWFRLIGPF